MAAVVVGVLALSGAFVQAATAATPESRDPSPTAHRTIAGETAADGSTTFSFGDSGITVEPSAEAAPSRAKLASMAAVISCDLNVQNVHPSHHYDGTINLVTRVQCTGVAGHIRLATEMYRLTPSYKAWPAGTLNEDDTAWLQNNVATNCSEGPGTFRGWGWGTITPAPGYVLVGPADHAEYGNTTSVACGVAFAASNEPSLASRTTVTFVRSDLAASWLS